MIAMIILLTLIIIFLLMGLASTYSRPILALCMYLFVIVIIFSVVIIWTVRE